jgi:lysine-N-methylase
MTSDILHSRLLSQFACLGDKCEDTCCQSWSMQVDDATLSRCSQKAPELLKAVETEPDGSHIMRKSPDTGLCVKFENGLCGIHKTYGANFLGDACYFYPRVTRQLGGKVIMTAAMSCPEIVRIVLADEHAYALEQASVERLPQSLKNYLPEGLSEDDALAVHQLFLKATEDGSVSAEQIFLRIASVSRSLERIDHKKWPGAVPFYLAHADERLLPPEPDAADPFNVLHALCGLMVAAKKHTSPRLKQTIDDMEKALAVTLDWGAVAIHTTPQSAAAYQQVQAVWREKYAPHYAPLLRRWLQMQLSLSLYPFAGLGATLSERITIIGVRMATIKLALMCGCSITRSVLSQDVVVRVVQSLSRVLDHLGDAAFSLQIYSETGWIQEKRMRALIEN